MSMHNMRSLFHTSDCMLFQDALHSILLAPPLQGYPCQITLAVCVGTKYAIFSKGAAPNLKSLWNGALEVQTEAT